MTKTGFFIKRMIFFCAFAAVLFLTAGLSALAANYGSVYTFSDENAVNTRINVQKISGENTLVLPSAVKPDSVVLFGEFNDNADVFIDGELKKDSFSSGNEINLNDFCKDCDYRLEFSDKNGSFSDFTVRFLFSENIPAVFIVSDNPEENGRAWVEESYDKSNQATGFMVMQKSDGSEVYNGELTQIKGRGNSTWLQEKKPYQIKTVEKVDLLETGNSDNKSKTWLILANYMDPSLLNNSVALNIGKFLGMKTNIESTYVDLYYDGEYRGNYLLSEKVEIGSGRVAVEDMEEKNEGANPGVDIEELPINTATTANGAFFTYCEGMASPEDISGGYLIEMDYELRALEEICYFRTTRGQYMVVKSPEYASREEMEYIASLYQEYEDAVYNGGINPTTGKAYTDYVDGDSLACYYLLNEFSKARDFFASSAYLYKNAGEDKMYMGPLWDYDQSFAGGRFEEGELEHPYGASIYNTVFGAKLVEIDSFADLLKRTYTERFLPLVNEIVSENEPYTGVISLKEKRAEINSSAIINAMLWYNDTDWEKEADKLLSFINERTSLVKTLLARYPTANYSENLFRDVFPTDWYYSDVYEVNSLGYMKGVCTGFFDPYSNVRRSEVAQVLFNRTEDGKFYSDQKFSDVKENDWFADAVKWVASEGVMHGFDDGTFRPGQYITREELIVCLYKYRKEPQITEYQLENFADGKEVSPSAKNAVEWAIGENILIGDTDGRINPKANLTRAELAVILLRFSK